MKIMTKREAWTKLEEWPGNPFGVTGLSVKAGIKDKSGFVIKT
jgi:hypothetical protein